MGSTSTAMTFIVLATTFMFAASHSGVAADQASYKMRSQPVAVDNWEQVPRKLRICNAYAWRKPLDIYLVASRKMLTGDLPLAYKECRDIQTPLNEGDQIDFKSGELDVGTFYANGLPESQASLVIIPRRRDTESMAIQFDSHAFAQLQNAQVAVVDAYKGSSGSSVHIGDDPTPPQQPLQVELLAKAKRLISGSEPPQLQQRPTEELRYNSIVALNEGKYQISLVDKLGHEVNQAPMDVKHSENFIVMRVGSHAASENSHVSLPKNVADFPEELVVFPQLEKSSSVNMHWSLSVAVVLAGYMWSTASEL